MNYSILIISVLEKHISVLEKQTNMLRKKIILCCQKSGIKMKVLCVCVHVYLLP